MLRISKLTDYGTVLMAYLATDPMHTHNAKDIAEHTRIALPTVSKLLKLLAKGGLLVALRGAKGGYSLARLPSEITLAEIIHILEGNIGLTECSHHVSNCSMEMRCAIRGNWRTISDVIHEALRGITLAKMAEPLNKNVVPISTIKVNKLNAEQL